MVAELKERECEKKEYYFIICNASGEPMGVVRMYDFRGDSFCWGSWIIKKGAPLFVSMESALMIYQYGFYHLGFMKSHFDVIKTNQSVVKFHKGFGAQVVREDEQFYYFEISRAAYETTKQKYQRYYHPLTVIDSSWGVS